MAKTMDPQTEAANDALEQALAPKPRRINSFPKMEKEMVIVRTDRPNFKNPNSGRHAVVERYGAAGDSQTYETLRTAGHYPMDIRYDLRDGLISLLTADGQDITEEHKFPGEDMGAKHLAKRKSKETEEDSSRVSV